jgi:hypothetical protein
VPTPTFWKLHVAPKVPFAQRRHSCRIHRRTTSVPQAAEDARCAPKCAKGEPDKISTWRCTVTPRPAPKSTLALRKSGPAVRPDSDFSQAGRVPMACHNPAERAEIADTEVRVVYNLRVFNSLVFFESHQVHQIPQRLTKTERPKCVFWSPNGVQKMDASDEGARERSCAFIARSILF